MTIKQVCENWLENVRCRCKASTHAAYTRIVQRRILPLLADATLDSITPKAICEFIERNRRIGRLDHRGPLAPKTLNDMQSVLLLALRFGGKEITAARSNASQGLLPVLSATEHKKLVRHLRLDLNRKNFGILLALFTGLRIGELCALKWSDVDLQAGVLHISKTVQRIQTPGGATKTALYIDIPKSRASIRTIPITAFLLQELSVIAQPGYLLTGTEKCMEPRILQDYFQRLLKQAGFAHKNFHTLRHSFATRCVEAGMDAKTLSVLLGHSNVKFTLERYVHPSLEQKRKQMELLASCWV